MSQVRIDESKTYKMGTQKAPKMVFRFSVELGQNALNQSDFEILKSAISPKQLGLSAWYFMCLCRLKED